jgi:hypothetical protein
MAFEQPLPAFYSYAHKSGRDRRHLEELFDALARSRREKLFDDWDDRKLRAGQQWEDMIIERARKSRVFLLILTNRFIASDFCVGTELTIARALYAKRAAAIAPILAEDADWQIKELADFQVIMPFGKPVSASRRDRAWTAVSIDVRKMADDLLAGKYFVDSAVNLPPVPRRLPFTIGRDGEAVKVTKALEAAPSKKPFVCVLSGEQQGQSEFIESLLLDLGSVGKKFGLSSAPYRIEIASEAWVADDVSVESALDGHLVSKLETPPSSADRKGIASSFDSRPGLTILTCDLPASEWQQCGAKRFQKFLDYWAGWPDLKPDQPMIVFVIVHAEVEALQVPGGVFVPLSCLRQETVEKWLATSTKGRFLIDRIKASLGAVFSRRDCLPMEDFASAFLPLLQKYQA